jgi:CRP-like cAMP-binding protein
MRPDDLVAFLASTDLLVDVPRESLAAIAADMRPSRLAPGDTLFDEGSPGDAAYLIVDGELALTAGGVELLRHGPGAFVGEFSLIDDEPRSTAGVACSPLQVLGWRRDEFLRTLTADARVARGILRVLTRKLRWDVQRGVDLMLERARWRQDLSRSREIQAAMLPPESLRLGPIEVSGRCTPAGDVGGDFYDVLPFDDGSVGVMIVDVTGHGFYSGLFVAMAKSCLHNQARFDHAPTRVVAAMRRALALSLERRMLMTCAYAVVDAPRGVLRYANAGHPHPLHWRADQGAVTALEVLDPILGAHDVGEHEYHCREVPWGDGDLLVLFSDGVIETRSPAGEEFGRGRVERIVSSMAAHGAIAVRDAILQALECHAPGVRRRDDSALVVVRARSGAEGSA